jgi:Uncharacterized proteins, LmbE homologs
MGLTDIALKFAASVPKPDSFQRYLFIGPHPDDIEIGAGASAAKLVAEGKDVCFLICIDGRYGDGNADPDISSDELVELRKEEALKSAEELGVTDVRFLGLCDGGFYDYNELISGIAYVVGSFKPEIIFCPDPCVTSECHADHINVGKAARQIAYFAPYTSIMKRYGAASAPVKAIAFYFASKPNRFINTTGHLEKQLHAIFGCHTSQFPAGGADAKTISLYLKLRAFDFGVRNFCKTAEAFRVLGPTQMHCLPEAGD